VAGPLVVVGFDGASLELIEPWVAGRYLPVLGDLLARGTYGRLRSTLPAATFPAWTSLVTGVNPGRHGVLDFTERVPGTYRLRFVNGSHRRTPALWTRLSDAGKRMAVVTVPATYPPEAIAGVMISGWDTPLTTAIDGSFVYPRERWRELRAVCGRLPFADFQEVHLGPGWHERALASLLDGIERRTALVTHLLRHERWDALMVVYGESDTVAHHFWRFHDPGSPRFEGSPYRDAIRRVYEALDRALGAIRAAAPPEATMAVVSDHGSGGASDLAIHVNRRLAETGFLGFRRAAQPAARVLRDLALRSIPSSMQGWLLRQLPRASGRLEGAVRLAAIDWARTRAYSEELDYHPSVWINRAGREPQGCVTAAEYEAVRDAVVSSLVGWHYPDGRPVVSRVWRREEVYRGPALEQAPDLVLELASVGGYMPSCVRSDGPGPAIERLPRERWGGGKGSGMSGSHRREGLFAFAGPQVRAAGRLADAEITDVLPTLLALAGEPIPEGLDGRPIGAALNCTPQFASDPCAERREPSVASSAAAYGELAQRLEALGYWEPSR